MKNQNPQHIAIIMDGNRRWAKKKGLDPSAGHRAGVDALERTLKASAQFGIKYLTVYALSTENLKERSKFEISLLFSLIKKGISEKLPMLQENGVRVKFVGDVASLSVDIQGDISRVEKILSKNERVWLNVCLNYGGRDEIVQAVRAINKKTSEITVGDIEQNLFTTGIPNPDLIIRTGGQKRLSNFLLWQSSYAELFFTETLWPDFGKGQLQKIILNFAERERNFGK